MRIAILTLAFNNNYGGFLQAYALQTALMSLGHDVYILNYRKNKIYYKQLLKKAVHSLIALKNPATNLTFAQIYKYKGQKMHMFVKKYMHLSEQLSSQKDIKQFCKKKDINAIVVGSDQVWRPQYVSNISDYFLGYIDDNIIKFSYAASFGTDKPEYTQKENLICKTSLKQFKAIGLREISGFKTLNYLKWDSEKAQIVIDPTLLLPKEHYESLLINYQPQNDYENKILTYILDIDNELKQTITTAKQKLKKSDINIIDLNKWKSDNYIMPPIEEWLTAFNKASFIITDSFHGMVFAILMEKPFAIYINKGRGSTRFNSLLSQLELSSRIISSTNPIEKIIETPIDWKKNNMKLNDLRELSYQFIIDTLK